MTHLTDDELDAARANEAVRRIGNDGDMSDRGVLAARLAREGWMPPKPVDPAREAVKEALACGHDLIGSPGWARDLRKEKHQFTTTQIDAALASLRKSGVLK